MGVDLDWQFDKDDRDDRQSRPAAGGTGTRARPMPAYSGLERHPDLMNLVVKSGFSVERDPAGFYLKMSFVVFGFLLAMYVFV